ncbi:hypothetical protein [Bifidobacterium aquikefiri]|uniref:hypothetical protein n=1 Tax=Bifidobacterium aquikefiri TaxID=1653207 RepID=UPI0023F1387F|nr:hypothetical protein [Bifidobacterium aquikefiri]
MTTQSTIDYSNTDLQALGRAYQNDTERLERIMLLPIGYHVGFACIQGAHGSRTWELNVFHCDESDEIDFDTAIAQGTLQEVETALHTLMAADHAHRRTLDYFATTPVEPSKTEPKPHEWHSRFENIERPTLILEHTPGWTWQDTGDTISPTYYLFRSTDPVFGIQFDVIERQDGSLETSLLSETWDELVSAEDLLKYGDGTKRFAQWLDDCAIVSAWVRGNDTEGGYDHE